jgi:hypothetical protein
MAYVLKDAEGNIIAASPTENPGQGWELIEDDPKDYVKFLEKSLAKSAPFRESDIQLVRVLEDLITLLIDRDVIRFTDLPAIAQQRLNDRESMRKKTNLSNLMVDRDDFIL